MTATVYSKSRKVNGAVKFTIKRNKAYAKWAVLQIETQNRIDKLTGGQMAEYRRIETTL